MECDFTLFMFFDGKIEFTIYIDFFPDILIIPIAPIPCGVDWATIVSFKFI